MKTKDNAARHARSLIEFVTAQRRAERRASCPVCALPDDIRTQLRASRGKKYDVPMILAWLASAGYQIKAIDYKAHGSSTHDQKDEAGV